MTTYVVLLRGVNVGRAKRLAMADLRGLLVDLGGTGVRTVLNSGNAVLRAPGTDPPELATAVRAGIADRFGLDVACVVRTGAELRSAVAANPFPHVEDGSRLMVFFLSAAPAAGSDPVGVDPARIRLGDRVAYQWCPDGLLAAPDLGAALTSSGVTATARNWNTVSRLVGLVGVVDES